MAVSALYPVPHTRTARAHVTVAAAVAAGDDAASAAAEEADDAERPTQPMLPLMPRGMDADAAMPMLCRCRGRVGLVGAGGGSLRPGPKLRAAVVEMLSAA